MRITCPHCGERPLDEFVYRGDATKRRTDGISAPEGEIFDYVYIRDNPAGAHREHWYHAAGCHSWLVVTRDTRTHEIFNVMDARNAKPEENP